MFNRIGTSTLVVMAGIIALNAAARLNPALAQWEELAKLTASDGVADDGFGGWVAIDGDNLVIGASKDDDSGTDSGSAYVFHFNGASWVEQQKLLASDGAAGDAFGRRVAISGNSIMIQAPYDQDCGPETGAVYAFRFNGSSWVQEQKIVPSDCASEDGFGYDIAISGDTAVITTPYDNDYGSKTGSAYVFQFNGSSWVEEQKLLAWDHASWDHFGRFAAIQGDTIVVGSAYDDDNGYNSGSVYVFHFNGSSWVQEQKLLASDGASGDHFGWSGGISGDSLVIGASKDDDSGTDSGSAYVFHFNGSTWVEQQKLLASDGAAGDQFAYTGLEISGDTIVVGTAYDDDYGSATGSAYVFHFSGSSWVEEQKILASDAAAGDHFGFVAIDGDNLVIGASKDDDNGTDSGSAYVFGPSPVADAGGPYSGVVGVPITFDASNSYDPDGSIVGYRWDWINDGDWDTDWLADPVTTHAYAAEFHGKVRLQVKDDHGATDTDRADVHIVAVAGPDLAILDGDLSIPAYMVEDSVYRIEATVRNIGSESAQYNFDVRFLAWGPDDSAWTTLETLGIFELGPGESTVLGTWFVPDEAGLWEIKAEADVDDVVPEEDEQNNNRTSQATVRPVVGVLPSYHYDIESETLNIDAIVHNYYAGEDITEGIVTWDLYDSYGILVPGHGGSANPFTYNPASERWENHGNDVSDLTLGETYLLCVRYAYSYPACIDFLKASGRTAMAIHVHDGMGAPQEDAHVQLWHPLLDYFHYLQAPSQYPPDYEGYTNPDGNLSFPDVPVGTYAARVSHDAFQPAVRFFVAPSDQLCEIDVLLGPGPADIFAALLDPLKDACDGTMDVLAEDLATMHNQFWNMSHSDGWDVAIDVADLIGSVMSASLYDAGQYSVIAFYYGIDLIWAREFFEVAAACAERHIVPQLLEHTITQALEGIKEVLHAGIVSKGQLMGTSAYSQISQFVEDEYQRFQDTAPEPSPEFDFSRAMEIRNYLVDRVAAEEQSSPVVVPFRYEEPRILRFQRSKGAFDVAYDAHQAASGAHDTLVVVQILADIGAIVAMYYGAGDVALWLIAIAHGVGVADTGAVTVELGSEAVATTAYGFGLGGWLDDIRTLPSVFSDAVDFFLEEGAAPVYLAQGAMYDVEIAEFDFGGILRDDGSYWLVVSERGGFSIPPQPTSIVVRNPDTNDGPVNVFADIDGDWRARLSLPLGETWMIDEVDGESQYHWWAKPSTLFGLVLPQTFRVDVYGGIPVTPSDYRWVLVWVYPRFPFDKGDGGLDTLLGMTTKEHGQLRLADTEDLLPTMSVVFEGELSADTPLLESAFTVSGDASSVEFHFHYPLDSIIECSVEDAQGRRIGRNLATGEVYVEFPGEVSDGAANPQIVRIPNATGQMFTVRVSLPMQYWSQEEHHVIANCLEVPNRPAVLAMGSAEVEIVASPGSEVTVRVGFGEAGEQLPLEDVEASLGPVVKDGEALPLLSDSPVEVGVILPGTGTSVPFTLEVPWEADAGVYTGDLEVTTSNAGSLAVTVLVDVSNAPNKPAMPSGPTLGLVDVSYEYSASTTDPEGDEIYYRFIWGDLEPSGWLGPYASGETCNESHAWAEPGRYHVIVAAKDGGDHVSDSSDELAVCIHAEPYADPDEDGDIDLQDFAAFSNCLAGPGVPLEAGCEVFDLDCDEEVDLIDFGVLQVVFTGQ